MVFGFLQNVPLLGAGTAPTTGQPGTVSPQGLPLGMTTKPIGVPFKRTLSSVDFTGIATADQTVTAGTFGTVGTFTVSAQQFATVGVGTLNNEPENQGKIFIDLEDTGGTDLDGVVRLLLANAQETGTITVLEERTERLSENNTNQTLWIHMPEYPVKVGEDSKIILQFKSDGSGTKVVDTGETTLFVDVTIYQ